MSAEHPPTPDDKPKGDNDKKETDEEACERVRAYARQQHGDKWGERFVVRSVEDLVELLMLEPDDCEAPARLRWWRQRTFDSEDDSD